MGIKRMFTGIVSLMLSGVLVLFSSLSSVTFAAEDTVIVPGPLSPRELSVPFTLDTDDIRLTDAAGRRIPFTGKGVQANGDRLSVFPPKLAEGVYVLSYPGGAETFTVGEELVLDSSSGKPVLLWGAAFAILVLGGILFVARRRKIAVSFALVALVLPLSSILFSPTPDIQAADPCLGIYEEPAHLRCMFDHVRSVLNDGDVARAVDRLEVLAGRHARWGSYCHEAAHYLGQLSWKETSDVERLVSAGTLSCSFGYFHGLLESIGTYSTDDNFPSIGLSVCTILKDVYVKADQDGSVRECAHGIGHASMWRHNEDLTAARSVCSELPQESWRQECDSGSVMSWVSARELSRVENRPQDAPEPVVAKPLDLCSPPLGVPTSGCVSGALSGTLRAEYADSLAWCRDNPGQEQPCASSLGRRMVTWAQFDGFDIPREARKMCQALHSTAAGMQDCISEVSWTHLFMLRDYDKTQKLCIAIGEDFAPGCRKGILLVYERMLLRGDESIGKVPPDVLAELGQSN